MVRGSATGLASGVASCARAPVQRSDGAAATPAVTIRNPRRSSFIVRPPSLYAAREEHSWRELKPATDILRVMWEGCTPFRMELAPLPDLRRGWYSQS